MLPAHLERWPRISTMRSWTGCWRPPPPKRTGAGGGDRSRAGPESRWQPAPVTPGQERLVVATHGAGVKPAAIAREFRLSRAQVDAVLAAAKQRRR